ncbi:MAG TPA: c-type cytochrome [Candidatus Udaeobacter sp.]|jgi:mono/diheme cytochrome c family protein|nr:c-type cytochrome [Candidatus Udaeobacter sp.]
MLPRQPGIRSCLSLIAVSISVILIGCGKSSQNSSTATSTPPPSTSAPSTTSAGVPIDTTRSTTSSTEVSLALGEKVFKQRCMLCHGPDGHGNGTAAAALKPHPRNFHDAAYMKSRTDDQLLLTIHNGKGPMPAWKTVLSEAEMRSALMYVRQFASSP